MILRTSNSLKPQTTALPLELLRDRRSLPRTSIKAMSLAIAILFCIGLPAYAAEPYGEVDRFGGFEAKASARDRFSMPVGFAVDSESHLAKTPDGNAIFVLDLVENEVEVKGGPGEGKGTLRYALHEFASSGEELGHAEISEIYTDTEHFTDAHPLVSLAVDPISERVYATVESIVREAGSGEKELEPVVDEIVAWSTEPTAEGRLVAPQGSTIDTVTNSGGLVSSASELLGSDAATDLYAPQGLVAGSGDVVIEAQNGVTHERGGATVLKDVATKGAEAGKVIATWEASTALAPKHEPADALFASTDGSGEIGLGFYRSATSPNETLITPVARVSKDFSNVAVVSGDTSNGADVDQALATTLVEPPNVTEGTAEGRRLVTEVNEPGGSIAQLIGGERLYAALYGRSGGLLLESQAEGAGPWQTGNGYSDAFWVQGNSNDEGWANMGVRLVNSDGKIVDTIGGGEPNAAPTAGAVALQGSCDIDFGKAAIAPGAKESLFVMTATNEKDGIEATSGDEVIEFAPGGHYKCPTMTGNIEVNGSEIRPEAGDSTPKVTVQQGVEIQFDAISLDQPILWNPPVLLAGSPFIWGDGTGPGAGSRPREWAPFAFEWDFGDEPNGGASHDGFTVVNEMSGSSETPYSWPDPETEHAYQAPGAYEAAVRVYSEYGVDTFPFDVDVLASGAPIARFTAPSSIVVGTAAEFNASGSEPAVGAEIEDYHWEFGDGKSTDSAGPRVSHVYGASGEYAVTLTVHDNEGAVQTASTVKKVVVEKSETVASTTTTMTTTSSPAVEPQPKASVKVLTTSSTTTHRRESNAEKLTKALKACRKDKQKRRRESCERAAKKKYGPKKSKTGKHSGRH